MTIPRQAAPCAWRLAPVEATSCGSSQSRQYWSVSWEGQSVLVSPRGGTLLTSLAGRRLAYSGLSVLPAFLSSSLIGVGFGFMPARSASRLDPVDALARE